tara:strand:- start:639 stop:986 length:348 start_codon:yes stop_codon:yes gene_type:complete
MATNANWTVIFDDKTIIKNTGAEAGAVYEINDDSFWSQAKYSNIWAIQHGTSESSDEVEHRDGSPHCSFSDEGLGDIQDFITKWDTEHLAKLQSDWDADERDESEKGSRPTSYSS